VTLRREGSHGPPIEARVGVTVMESTFDPADPTAARIALALELPTLTTGDEARDVIVKGPDFLDVAAHPRAIVSLLGLTAGGSADAYDARLTLLVRGATKDATAAVRVVEQRPDGVRVLEVEALSLPLEAWGLAPKVGGLSLDPTIDVRAHVELPPPTIGPAKGSPDEIYLRLARHQGEVLDLIEAAKDDPERAAQAVEEYAARHRAELGSLAAALNRLTPGQLEALLQTNEAALRSVMQRGARVLGDNPRLEQNERFRQAMDALGAAAD